jgi:hypothetical protein
MAKDIIESMYDELKRLLMVEKKLRNNSVLLSFLKIKSNSRLSYLERTCQPEAFFLGQLEQRLSNKDIQHYGEDDKYCLTADYVWRREKEHILNNDFIPQFFDEEYFNCPKYEGITEKEKVIIFTLLFARAFSEGTAMDLKIGENYWSKWEELTADTYDVLTRIGLITNLQKDALFSKSSTENKVSSLFRHTDVLKKKTFLRFVGPGEQKYYIDVCDAYGNFSAAELVKLLKIMVKGDTLSLEMLDKLSEDSIGLAHSKGLYLTDVKNPYINLSVDMEIRRSFEELIFN